MSDGTRPDPVDLLRKHATEARQRGDGRTTLQMLQAPQRAVFVWCNGHLDYPRSLARHLGRADLDIVSPDALRDGGQRFRGLNLSGVIVDHAFAPTKDWEFAGLQVAHSRVRDTA